MEQLTGLDAFFLALETANTTGHVGGVSILDPRDAPEPLTLARLTGVLAERLPLVPVLRRKLLYPPLGLDQPYWVDDADFDIEYHVREIALPRPGSEAQLTEQVSRLHAWPRSARRSTRRSTTRLSTGRPVPNCSPCSSTSPRKGASCPPPSRSGPPARPVCAHGRRSRSRAWRGSRS
jgi:hypothetical protein